MRENYRNSIASIKKFPQFTTMNVIDGQAGLIICASLIFYSLTIDNILNIIILLILAGISIGTLSGDSGIINQAGNAKKISEIAEEKEIIEAAAVQAMGKNKYGDLTKDNLQNQINNYTNQDKSVEVEKNGNDLIVSFIKSGRTYIVDNDGNCKEVDWLQRSDGTIINKDGTIILKIKFLVFELFLPFI